MASKKTNTKAAESEQKAVETADEKKIETAETADIQKVEKVEKKRPVVEAGDYFRHAKVKMLDLLCAPYGTYHKGDIATIPYRDAVEMAAAGRCEILED